MAHLIDKDALVAELQRLSNEWRLLSSAEAKYRREVYTELLSFINTLEVKEPVSEDLEKVSKEWLTPQLDKSYADYGDVKMMELTHFDGYAMLDAIEFGAQWQRERMKETLQMEYEKGRYDMREELMHDDKFLKAIGHTYVEWIDAGINTNDVDPADYIRDHLFD